MKKADGAVRIAMFELRMRLDWTQRQMGKELHMSMPTVARAEHGDISTRMAYKLSVIAEKYNHPDLAKILREYVLTSLSDD